MCQIKYYTWRSKNFDNKIIIKIENYFCLNLQDGVLLLRHLSMQKRKSNSLRDNRPYILAENFELEGEEATGTLKVTGYVRGGNGTNLVPRLSVNKLVHIPGWGSYQLSQVNN